MAKEKYNFDIRMRASKKGSKVEKTKKNGKHGKEKKPKKLKILIAAKQNQVGFRAAKRVAKELQKFAEVEFDKSTAQKRIKWRMHGTSVAKFKGDLIITLGGDGTFLWTAYQANVPILPIRLEGHGFLCTADLSDLLSNMKTIAQRNWTVTKRARIKASKLKPGLIEKILHKDYPQCVNEIAFARRRPSKVLKAEFIIDGVSFAFWGDGVMFATPAGSTAYAASAGGPLMDHSVDAMSIIPLYPFHSSIKPMVVPTTKRVEVRIHGGDCALIIDGHTGEYVKSGSRFIVERGEPIRVVTLKEVKFYEKYKRQFLIGETEKQE